MLVKMVKYIGFYVCHRSYLVLTMAPRNSVAVCGEMPIAAIVPILLAGTYYTGTIEGPLLLYQGKTVQKRGKKNTTLKQGNTQRLT